MMSENQKIEIIPIEPNPLFVKWLEEWYEKAKENDTLSKHKLKEAINSLKKFPLSLTNGRDCGILRGFGPVLCNHLDKRLELYKKHNLHEYEKSFNNNSNKLIINKIFKSCQKQKYKKETFLKKNSLNQIENTKLVFTHDSNKLNKQISSSHVLMKPGTFDIILLVDTQETSGKFKKVLDETKQYFESHKIKYEVQRLGVGDFCWICRKRCTDDNIGTNQQQQQQNDLILPYIIERKRMDDFVSSIRDGRFHEQKFRLRSSGIKNVIYMIESYNNNKYIGLPISTLMQAATSTQIQNKFQIKFTDSHQDSMRYICTLTKILIEKFKDKTLFQIPKVEINSTNNSSNFEIQSDIGLMNFKEFQEESIKTKQFRIKELFIKQLLQLKTLSIDKALAIANVYPTPQTLISAYKSCNTKDEAEMLLANIPSGKLKRTIGTFISKVIYEFYNNLFFSDKT